MSIGRILLTLQGSPSFRWIFDLCKEGLKELFPYPLGLRDLLPFLKFPITSRISSSPTQALLPMTSFLLLWPPIPFSSPGDQQSSLSISFSSMVPTL